VQVSVTDHNGYLELMVDDDGPGIAVAQREHIFMPFHRVDSSRSRDTGGYGLGLAIAKRICELHHAQLQVDDSPLGGARFVVRFRAEVMP
jgi:signal transduction histidine kinase